MRIEEHMWVLVHWRPHLFEAVFLLKLFYFLHSLAAFFEWFFCCNPLALPLVKLSGRESTDAFLRGPNAIVVGCKRPLVIWGLSLHCALKLLYAIPLAAALHELITLVFVAKNWSWFVFSCGLDPLFLKIYGAHQVTDRLRNWECLTSKDALLAWDEIRLLWLDVYVALRDHERRLNLINKHLCLLIRFIFGYFLHVDFVERLLIKSIW